MGGTRPADRPASAGRWGREASTDHSHEDGEGAVDAVLFTLQDPRTTRHRRVPATPGPATAPGTAKHEITCGFQNSACAGWPAVRRIDSAVSYPSRCRWRDVSALSAPTGCLVFRSFL